MWFPLDQFHLNVISMFVVLSNLYLNFFFCKGLLQNSTQSLPFFAHPIFFLNLSTNLIMLPHVEANVHSMVDLPSFSSFHVSSHCLNDRVFKYIDNEVPILVHDFVNFMFFFMWFEWFYIILGPIHHMSIFFLPFICVPFGIYF